MGRLVILSWEQDVFSVVLGVVPASDRCVLCVSVRSTVIVTHRLSFSVMGGTFGKFIFFHSKRNFINKKLLINYLFN